MSTKILATLFVTQMLCFATAIATATEIKNEAGKVLDGFATVGEAKSTEIQIGMKSEKKQPAYLGLLVERIDGKVVVEEVAVNSPAAEANFVRGDVLLKADKVDLKFQSELTDLITKHAPGDSLRSRHRKATRNRS